MGVFSVMMSTLPQISGAAGAMTNVATPHLPNTPQMHGSGGTSIHSPVSVGKVDIHTQGRLSDADNEALAYEFSEAMVRGAEITFTAHGASS